MLRYIAGFKGLEVFRRQNGVRKMVQYQDLKTFAPAKETASKCYVVCVGNAKAGK